MGIWDKPEQYRKLSEIRDIPIRILSAGTRDNIDTLYGKKTAVDLTVDIVGGEKLDGPTLFSGISAGIVQMVRGAEPDDFPTWARIVSKDLGGGKSTLVLEPVSEDDIKGVAESLGMASPDDDIPF